MPETPNFLSLITGSFASPAAENPTVAMIEAAYRHHGVNARYVNCEVAPLGGTQAVRGEAGPRPRSRAHGENLLLRRLGHQQAEPSPAANTHRSAVRENRFMGTPFDLRKSA